MKALYLIGPAFVLFTNCNQDLKGNTLGDTAVVTEDVLVIDAVEVLKEDLVLNPIEATWYYNNQPYSGYAVKKYPNGMLAEKLGYMYGKRQGIAKTWSDNGVLRTASYYKHNRLNAVYKTWWENGVLSSKSNYVDGIKQGDEKEWYPSGQLAKHRQLVDGQEVGLQKAWLPNGTLYVNYEAKNGRIFGMRKANSCYKLENEIVKEDKEI